LMIVCDVEFIAVLQWKSPGGLSRKSAANARASSPSLGALFAHANE